MKTSQYEKGNSLIVGTVYRGLFDSKGYVFFFKTFCPRVYAFVKV